jgi:hypothetical protein
MTIITQQLNPLVSGERGLIVIQLAPQMTNPQLMALYWLRAA